MSRKKKISGEQALEEAYAAIDTAPLLASLNVELEDKYLRLALTHRSFANEHGHLPNNERLEFLGDAVLGLSIAARLYEKYPTRPESDISKMRASIVSRFGLADVAREIGLGAFILLGKGEANSNGRDKDSILADTTEALFGAIYLQHGFETARRVILELFAQKVDAAVSTRNHMDWKTTLQELCAERKLPTPDYSATSTGPEHDQLFTAQVHVDGQLLGEGVGPNKKQAEQQAAEKAALIIRVN
ncbi:ribonuclease III [Corynebacterium ammoniagenes]|uniref:Ribonuclease 3 n=2 Tax=Corynebacterium ammoniagenes TaxID=1697 RepID=A0AAV5G4X1_CORAM|nr:ribonuclease III [Corynebacterium ammoniagenes]APT82369.1 ribonuclease III [Corynebacterium ammoniagenes DSM 20306]AQS73454.1 ribonuclease III [Corynebacterium ammoniagenes]EFG82577.1 ribonuclease III [Corynebacterium ammoniagenes DSM 20306]NMF31023.1 ribonuclease III [Corynebacterium ammoniagenes]GJN42197.1 ribonuclease 3 [Corynebacterium ammoniagenes]